MTPTDLSRRAEGLRAGRMPYVLATVVRAERPTSAKAGDRALVLGDGTIEGFVGGVCAESTVRLQGLRLLRTGESTLLRITPLPGDAGPPDDPAGESNPAGERAGDWTGEPGGDPAGGPAGGVAAAPGAGSHREGLVTVANACLSGGTLEIFLEAVIPPPFVHVFGDAPVARALAGVGAALGYTVDTVVDPRGPIPADTVAVVVASHGRDEEPVLTAALRAGVPYVGLVASRRRGAEVVSALPVGDVERARIRTPAGMDIGARTPAEIALSVFAEMVAARPRGGPAPAVDVAQSGPDSAGGVAQSGPDSAGGVARPGTDSRGPAGPAGVAEAVDPVCGMTVAVSEASLRLDRAGATWYFCGPGCRQAFADDPGRYPS